MDKIYRWMVATEDKNEVVEARTEAEAARIAAKLWGLSWLEVLYGAIIRKVGTIRR